MQNEQIRVLLVDDDQGDFEMIRVMLTKAEHQIVQARLGVHLRRSPRRLRGE